MAEISKIERKPRVLLVVPLPPPTGGMSIQAIRLQQALSRENVDVCVVPTNITPPRALATISRIPILRTSIRVVKFFSAIWKRSREADVIHHMSASGLYFWIHTVPVVFIGKIRKKRVVINYRGGLAAQFFRKWMLLIKPVLRSAAEITVPSEFLKRIFAQYEFDVTVVPNIADVERFKFRRRSVIAPRLIVTRHLEPMYGIETILRAFKEVQLVSPESKLSIVGSGSQETFLRDLASSLNLNNVVFTGTVGQDQLPELYESHDILVNASTVDNFPGSLVEAACSGLIVVTTKAGGIPDMIQDGHNGLLVELGDAAGLAKAVLRVIDDQGLARDLIENARRWSEQYRWSNVFPKLARSYGFADSDTNKQVSAPVPIRG